MKENHLALDLRSYGGEVQSHQHDYHQLVFSVDGRLSMNVGCAEGCVSQRQAAIVHAGEDHGFASQENNCFLVADVPSVLAPELERLPSFVSIDDSLVQYIQFLCIKLRQGDSNKNSERQMLLLLIQLLRERFGGEKICLDRRIEAARSYIDEHFSQTISLRQLAVVANLSIRQLSDLFRRQLGMTPQQFMIEKRMQLAWQLLKSDSLNVQQISEKVGYASPSAFSDRFRKHFGRSPRYFRQNDE
jgi:AraC-like DNA-binding protein